MNIDHGPALTSKSRHYPRAWKKRTPKTIRMVREVVPDALCAIADPSVRSMRADGDAEYPAWTNSHGAVCAVFPDGKHLGLKPAEFEVVEWFEADGVTVTRVEPAPEAAKWTGGPMSMERAIEINRGIQACSMARLVDGEHKPLPKCSLEEMCAATRICEERMKAGEPVGMITDPRGIAAMYAFEKFGCDVHALLGTLGFRLTNGRDEDSDEDD